MKKCSACKNSISDESKFCLYCGTSQENDASIGKSVSKLDASISEKPAEKSEKPAEKNDNQALNDAQSPIDGQEASTDALKCERCFAMISKEQSFCGVCGYTNTKNYNAEAANKKLIADAERFKQFKQLSAGISISSALQLIFLVLMIVPVISLAFSSSFLFQQYFSSQIYKLSSFILSLGNSGIVQKTIAGIITVFLSSLLVIAWLSSLIAFILMMRSKTQNKEPNIAVLRFFSLIALACVLLVGLFTFVYMTFSFIFSITLILYANIALAKSEFVEHLSTRKNSEKNLQAYTMLFASMLFVLLFASIVSSNRISSMNLSILSLTMADSGATYIFFLTICPIIILLTVGTLFALSVLAYVFSIRVKYLIYTILLILIFITLMFVGTGSYVSYLENNYFALSFWYYIMTSVTFFALMLRPLTKVLDYAKSKKNNP